MSAFWPLSSASSRETGLLLSSSDSSSDSWPPTILSRPCNIVLCHRVSHGSTPVIQVHLHLSQPPGSSHQTPPLLPVPFLSSVLLHGMTFSFFSDRDTLWMHCVFLSLLIAAGDQEHIPSPIPTPPAQFIYTTSLIPCGKFRLPYLGIRLQKLCENNFS